MSPLVALNARSGADKATEKSTDAPQGQTSGGTDVRRLQQTPTEALELFDAPEDGEAGGDAAGLDSEGVSTTPQQVLDLLI